MLTPLQLQQRADARFADNEFQNITERSFRDFTTDLAQTFVAQAVANVPDYEPGRNYAVGFVIRHAFGGAAPVFLAALAPGGLLPAPTSAAGDASWERSLSPATGQALSQVGTVDALRHMQGDWVPGRLYLLLNRLDAQGDPLPDVYVQALTNAQLAPEAYVFDKVGLAAPERVRYDLATDTTQPLGSGYTKDEANALLTSKVDKIGGKGLSTNDYTDREKNRLAALNVSLSRSTHTTYAGHRYTGPVVIYSRPGALTFVPIDANVYGYAFQVNYQDVANPGYWVAGSYLAEISDVEAALATVPAASFPLGVRVRATVVPFDNTLEASCYIDGLGAGVYEGSTRQFLVSYAGPPLGTLNANSQFRDPFPSGWTSKAAPPTSVSIGGGVMIMSASSNNLDDLNMATLTLYAGTDYKLVVGVSSIGSGTTLNVGLRNGGAAFTQVDYVNTLGETTIYFTVPYTSAGWFFHIFGAQDIQVTHMYLLEA